MQPLLPTGEGKDVEDCHRAAVASMFSSSNGPSLPMSFNLYYGFGEPLEVLDDRDLLTSMAQLKQRALSPKRNLAGLDGDTPELMAPAPPPSTRPHSAAPRKKSGIGARPSSAPPKRQQQPSAAAQQQQQQQQRSAGQQEQQPQQLTDGERAESEASHQEYNAPPPSFQQVMERRDRFMREEEKTRRRELQRLEKRWEEADAKVEAKREQAAQDARARVEQWGKKRSSGKARLEHDNAKRLDALTTDLLKKEERLRRYHERMEREERQKREEHAQMRMEAAQRFATGVRARTFRLQEAEERVARRAGAMAALRRQELQARSERADQKAMANLQLRMRQEAALEAKARQTEEKTKQRAAEVEAFLQKQRLDHEARVEAKRLQGKGGGDGQSPRTAGGQPYGASQQGTPRGSGKGTPRGKKAPHAGETGLEVLPQKCALCEQSFSQLTGVTFLKAVATQRAKFGDDSLLRWCTKRGLQTMYDSASLCTFCCQFFAEGWRQADPPW